MNRGRFRLIILSIYNDSFEYNNKIMFRKSSEKQIQQINQRQQTIDTTKSSFHNLSKQHDKIFSLRKNKSIFIRQSPERSPISFVKNFQSLPRRASLSENSLQHRLYVSNIFGIKPLPRDSKPEKPQLYSSSICSIFTDSNEPFIMKNCDQKRQIASLTKIMTAFTVINICNSYGVKIRETTVTVEKEASMMEGTSANLRNGDRFYVIDLLYGLLLPSGNDAALALAQYFGKFLSFTYSNKMYESKQKNQENVNLFQQIKHYYDAEYAKDSIKLFVFEMNKNCFKMNLKNTRFSNPTGLSDIGNYSTARDLTKLIQFCLKNHLLSLIFRKKSYTCTAVNQKLGLERLIEWKNTNKHLFEIRDCIGVKTGITPSAGPCLSSAYKIRGRQLIVVILNSRSLQDRYDEAHKIYKYAKLQCSQQQNL